MCGETATDFSDASGTGLHEVTHRTWPVNLLDTLQLPPEWFPHVHDAAADAMGLRPGVPVTYGGGDAVVQSVGCGAVDSSYLLIVVGTGGNVTTSSSRVTPNPDGAFQSFCHVVPDSWVTMGVTMSAGSSLRWFRDTFGSPEMAVASAISFSAYELLDLQASLAQVVSGGGASSKVWRQIVADVFGADVRACTNASAADAVGAAMIAGVDTGKYSISFKEVTRLSGITTVNPAARFDTISFCRTNESIENRACVYSGGAAAEQPVAPSYAGWTHYTLNSWSYADDTAGYYRATWP